MHMSMGLLDAQNKQKHTISLDLYRLVNTELRYHHMALMTCCWWRDELEKSHTNNN